MAEPTSIPVPPPGERGRDRDGNQVEVDRRLYMQLLVFRGRLDEERLRYAGEHGRLGAAFGKHGYGVDIRLACQGIDRDDNDFLLGLVGPSLHRLSLIVQTMRKTRHTAEFLERLGPFFVGKVLHRSVSP